jgi:hypothetical protein
MKDQIVLEAWVHLKQLNEENIELVKLYALRLLAPSIRSALAGVLILWGCKLYRSALKTEDKKQ